METRNPVILLLLASLVLLGGCNDESTTQPGPSPVGSNHLVRVIGTTQGLSTFHELIVLAGMDKDLSGPGPYTVFAPTNEAFAQMPAEHLAVLRQPDNHQLLMEMLNYHIVPARILADVFERPSSPITLQGERLFIATIAGTIIINDGALLRTNIMASNGIVHTVDTVLSTTPELD